MGYMGYGPRLPNRTIDHRRGLPRLPEGAPLDLDEYGERALVRRRLEIGLRLVGRQRYAMDAAPCAAFRAVAREGARRPSRGAASHGRHWLFKVAFAYLLS